MTLPLKTAYEMILGDWSSDVCSSDLNLLTYAFGAEIIDRIPIASLKRQLEQTVLEQTAGLP